MGMWEVGCEEAVRGKGEADVRCGMWDVREMCDHAGAERLAVPAVERQECVALVVTRLVDRRADIC